MENTQLLSLTLNEQNETKVNICSDIIKKLDQDEVQYLLTQIHIINELLIEAFNK